MTAFIWPVYPVKGLLLNVAIQAVDSLLASFVADNLQAEAQGSDRGRIGDTLVLGALVQACGRLKTLL